MTHFGKQVLTLQFACANITYAFRQGLLKRFYSATKHNESATKKKPHPYRSIHPWKSQVEFTKYLIDNLIYNKDGIVVLNKPYGISGRPAINKENQMGVLPHLIANPVNYTIEDTLPAIAKELGYQQLKIGKCPERYTSGVTILFGRNELQELMEKSIKRTMGFHHMYRTFWIVTTMVPKQMSGKQTLGLKLHKYADGNKKAILTNKYSNREVKNGDVKLLHVEFKVLANSTYNLSSLLEIKASKTKWHAVRLFTATQLLAPVLGDNYYGCSIRNIMGTWFPVKHLVDNIHPELNDHLLKMLSISKAQQEIIPAHMHLRSIILPSLLKRGQDFIVEAPLLHPFDWTCKQLFSQEKFDLLGQPDKERELKKLSSKN